MSMKDCIDRSVKMGLMDAGRAEWASSLFDDALNHAKTSMGETEALAAAREETLKAVAYQLARKRRSKLMNAAKARDMIAAAKASGVGIERGMLATLAEGFHVKGIENIEGARKATRALLHSGMTDALATFRRNLRGAVRAPATLANMIRELHGEATGDVYAKELAKAFSDTAEKARKMFNSYGGDIPKLEGWGLPHSHDGIVIRKAGFDTWFKEIRSRVDLSRMKDYVTGRAMDETGFAKAARDIFDNVTTEGWAGREATGTAFGSKLGNRRMDHRFFVFKSADDWAAYNEKFGIGDPYSAMLGHLDGMARDIGAMKVLGDNPTAMLRWMGDVINKDILEDASRRGIGTDAPESQARGVRRTIDNIWEGYTGAANAPINGRAARTFAGIRTALQSAQLGGTALAAITDLGFQKQAAGQIGIPMRKILSRYVGLLNPANLDDRKVAVRLGLIAEEWSNVASAQQRYLGEVNGPEITRRVADVVMRISGLSPWTQAGRWAFGMEFSGLLADNVGKTLGEIDLPLRRTMENYGITPQDWELARATPMMEHKGATFLRAEDMPDENLAFKFLEMLHGETEFAVPSTSLRGRSALIGEVKPGTIQGEVWRSVSMYKNFAATLMMTHHRRIMGLPGGKTGFGGERGRYAAQLMLSMTLMGGMAMQTKEIAKGRDPRQMFSLEDPAQMAKFWGAAALQGGGLGIFGDFLFSQKNRYDKGLAQTVAGPVVGAAGDFIGYFNDNATRAMNGEKTKLASGAIDLVQRYSPGSSLWWASTGLQNLVFDEMRRMVDPETDSRLRRIERGYKTDYGQDYWYSRERGIKRAPNLGAAFGE